MSTAHVVVWSRPARPAPFEGLHVVLLARRLAARLECAPVLVLNGCDGYASFTSFGALRLWLSRGEHHVCLTRGAMGIRAGRVIGP